MEQTKFDSQELSKDLDVVLKKHGVLKAIFIAENVNENNEPTLVVIAENSVPTTDMIEASHRLMSMIGMDPDNMQAAADVLQSYIYQQEREQKAAQEKAAIASLSEDDQKRIDDIRAQKNELVKKQDYENAARLRSEERDLLGKGATILKEKQSNG